MNPSEPYLQLHHFQPASLANGPGWRAVIWVQGCTLACPGCFNPESHASNQGSRVLIRSLVNEIIQLAPSIEGITISGGEPLQQIQVVTHFLSQIRTATNLSVILFSGYRWSEIQTFPRLPELLAHVDVLLAGRYEQDHRLATSLVGSSNKTVHFLTGRYNQADFDQIPAAEIILTKNGETYYSGIDPLH